MQRLVNLVDSFIQRAAGVLMMLLGGGCAWLALQCGAWLAALLWAFAAVLVGFGFVHTFTRR